MQAPRVTRSSVLGKRGHQQEASIATPTKSCDVQLPTPDSTPNPKRARTSISYYDGDSNKENVPPLSNEAAVLDTPPSSSRSVRPIRRTATELPSPSRPRPIRKHASTTSIIPIPSHEISRLATPPTAPKLLLPLHARVKSVLRATCNDASSAITCRDAERDVITNFIQPFVNEEAIQRCLYISGSPGTGKTALLNSVLQTLNSDLCNVISINCMILNGVDALWKKLFDDLVSTYVELGKILRLRKLKGRGAVEAVLAALSTKCILVLDELDHIATDSSALDGILALPDVNPKSFRLIGIANTHTLMSGASSATCLTARNALTIRFAPYNAMQLQEILQSRLDMLNNDYQGPNDDGMASFLPSSSLALLTKKVAAMTGDVRSLFEVLRGAIDIAVSSSISGEDPLTHSPKVTPTFILQALKSYTPSSHASKAPSRSELLPCNSEIVAKINGLNLQARVVLLCVLLGSKRLESGLPLESGSISPRKATPLKRSSSAACSRQMYIDTAQLHNYYSAALLRCDASCLNVVSKSELGDLLVILEGAGLVTSSGSSHLVSSTMSRQGRKVLSRSASLSSGLRKNLATSEIRLAEGVWENEVLRGLGIANITDDDVLQCEIRGIWEREVARLSREKNQQYKPTNFN
ncbi:hypothetical protein AX15_004252 [Amanita polypyramis BW_CC]|nr:hypothetical protein AX15_004252 [Amanita polypyramis BW_CC]